MSNDSTKKQTPEMEIIIDKDELIERFKSSDLYKALSRDDRTALMKGIENDEITIREIDKILRQEKLLNEYFEKQTAIIVEDIVDVIVMASQRTKKIMALKKAGEEQHAEDAKNAEKLLN